MFGASPIIMRDKCASLVERLVYGAKALCEREKNSLECCARWRAQKLKADYFCDIYFLFVYK